MEIQRSIKHGRLGLTPAQEPFLVWNRQPNVAHMIAGAGNRVGDFLAREYRRRYGRIAPAKAIADALATLRGEAMDKPTEEVHLRVARLDGKVIIDLGGKGGNVAIVTRKGWSVESCSPVLFRRTALTGELPTPVRGGSIDQLRKLLNVTDESWSVCLGWILAAFLPDIAHPILLLGGQQGTGKSTAARLLSGLFDPSPAPLRSPPRDPESWVHVLSNAYSSVVDNVSSIPSWFSDSLCKASTGDGSIRRKLDTDGQVVVDSFRSVIMITSIDAGALQGDLGKRLVLLDLEPIASSRRQSEKALLRAYEAARPSILGALLDLLVKVLSALDSVTSEDLPRMADFALVLRALDQALGTRSFATYMGQSERIAEEVVESDPVGTAVAVFMQQHAEWQGTASELLAALESSKAPSKKWPTTGRGMAACLKRLAPALRLQGVEVTPPDSKDKTRRYGLRSSARTAQSPQTGPGEAMDGDGSRAIANPAETKRPGDRPAVDPLWNPPIETSRRLGDSGGCLPNSATHQPEPWSEVAP
jgi:hypothetical protein